MIPLVSLSILGKISNPRQMERLLVSAAKGFAFPRVMSAAWLSALLFPTPASDLVRTPCFTHVIIYSVVSISVQLPIPCFDFFFFATGAICSYQILPMSFDAHVLCT